jgi:hypothetical protein
VQELEGSSDVFCFGVAPGDVRQCVRSGDLVGVEVKARSKPAVISTSSSIPWAIDAAFRSAVTWQRGAAELS